MYVAVIPNRGSPPAILMRESYREASKTKNRTLANLSRWPAERIEQLRAVLRGDKLLPAAEAVEIVRALPHGHVLAALGTARRIALDAVLPRRAPQRRRDLALALIVASLLEPAAKLATARMLDPATRTSHSRMSREIPWLSYVQRPRCQLARTKRNKMLALSAGRLSHGQTHGSRRGTRSSKSRSLQRRVRCEPDFLRLRGLPAPGIFVARWCLGAKIETAVVDENALRPRKHTLALRREAKKPLTALDDQDAEVLLELLDAG
jgi:hypothetical protein